MKKENYIDNTIKINNYENYLFYNSDINTFSSYEDSLFVFAQIIQNNIEETKKVLQPIYKGRELNKLVSEIQKADPYQDKRMMSTIATWLINSDINTPNEHTEDIKEFSKLRKQVKDFRFNITNEEIKSTQSELLRFDPTHKHYSEIQEQNIEMKEFLGYQSSSDSISDEGLPLVGEIQQDEDTIYRMYEVTSEDQLSHPLLKRMTYCVMNHHFGEYGGPPYYPVFKWSKRIPEQFAMIIPDGIEEDVSQAIRDSNNYDRLSSSDILLIEPLMKKVIPQELEFNSKFVYDLYHLEENTNPEFTDLKTLIDIMSNPNNIISLSDDWSGWEKIHNLTDDKEISFLLRQVRDLRFFKGPILESISQSYIHSYLYARDILKDRFPLGEPAIAQSPKYSYAYAKNIINGRFELGEQAISQDPEYSFMYARDILKGSFELGEEAISKNERYSYLYAESVIKDRFELGEEVISQDAESSFLYARYIIKDRFELGEEIISQSPEYSYKYAYDVLYGRFEPGEEIISTDSKFSHLYAENVIKGRFPLGEPTIAKDIRQSYYYARDIIKGRFELAEPLIAQDALYSYYYARDVLKGRFELGEKIIATEALRALQYAKEIIQGRFKLGEPLIARDYKNAYFYAEDILKGRFELGESTIAQNADYSYWYALNVLKGRFELGEEVILQSSFRDKYVEFLKRVGNYEGFEIDMNTNQQNDDFSYADSLFNIVIAQERQYFSPYGPGYASPYSDSTTEISNMGPIRNPDADNPHNEPRGWLYKTLENDLINEWGGDQGQKPNGMVKIKVEKLCRSCKGDGCSKCKYKGIIYDYKLKPRNSPKVDGRIRDQLRYKTEEEGGPYWSHNRDFNNIREEPQTWDQLMNDKFMLGKPSLY